MANANIFQQYLQPQKSVLDYQNEYAQADSLKTKNALQDLALQQQTAATAQGLDDRNALQRVAAQSGGTREGMIAGLRNSGRASLMAQADALEKSGADLSQSQSVTGKNNAETAQKNFDLHQSMVTHGLQSVIAATTPQQAAQAASDGVAQGYWSMADAQKKIAAIPQDQAQYAQWRLQQLGALVSAKDQLDAIKPTLGTTNTGGSTVYTARDPMTGAVTQNGSVVNTQSPDSVATTGLGYAKLGEEKRHNGATELQASSGGANKTLTEGQAKALGFGSRMQEADKLLAGYADQGIDRPGAIKAGLEAVPLIGGALGAAANVTQSSGQQGVEQAQRDFLNAILRRESGAAIGKEEFDSARKQYFPAIGDSDETKAQKARNRAIAIQGVMAEVPLGQRDSLSSPAAATPAATPAAAPLGIHPDAIAAELARRKGK